MGCEKISIPFLYKNTDMEACYHQYMPEQLFINQINPGEILRRNPLISAINYFIDKHVSLKLFSDKCRNRNNSIPAIHAGRMPVLIIIQAPLSLNLLLTCCRGPGRDLATCAEPAAASPNERQRVKLVSFFRRRIFYSFPGFIRPLNIQNLFTLNISLLV
jgi:hypothetical protein